MGIMVRLRSGLRHPLALTLLLASLMLAVAVKAVPGLEQWSSRAPLFLILGFLAYSAVVAVDVWTFPSPPLLTMARIRQAMAAWLSSTQMAGRNGVGRAVINIVAEGIGQMDREIVPALGQLVARNQALDQHLGRYRKGELPPPDPLIIERLQSIFGHQRVAIDACIQQAANAEASLVALTQENDEATLSRMARMWADDLQDIRDALIDAFRSQPYDEAIALIQKDSSEQSRIIELLDSAGAQEHEASADALQAGGKPVVPLATRSAPAGLTTRELEILTLVAAGKRSKEIAAELVLSISTVQRHIANIYVKIDARGRADATAWALTHHIVQPHPS